MKISEILQEDSSLNPLGLPIRQIQSDCSEFLSNPTLLIRGVDLNFQPAELVAKPTMRKDRKSLSGRHVGTKIFNEAFLREFGVANLRHKCLFITNDANEALRYGELYYIIPVNGSKVAYKPGRADSVRIVGESWHDFLDDLKRQLSPSDLAALTRAAMSGVDLHSPNIQEDWFEQLINKMSQDGQRQAHEIMDSIQHQMMQGYTIQDVGAITPNRSATEYMLFNEDRYWMILVDDITQSVPSRNYREGWDLLIKHLQGSN